MRVQAAMATSRGEPRRSQTARSSAAAAVDSKVVIALIAQASFKRCMKRPLEWACGVREGAKPGKRQSRRLVPRWDGWLAVSRQGRRCGSSHVAWMEATCAAASRWRDVTSRLAVLFGRVNIRYGRATVRQGGSH